MAYGKRFGERGRSEGRSFGGPRRSFGTERRSFGERRDFGEAPVKVGEEYDVEITETGSRGDGIARIKNFVVFIPNTKKGDKVRIKITEIRGKSAVGEVVGEASEKEEELTEEGVTTEVAKEEAEEEAGEEDSENF
jgi:predicted RNA-binding protein with TRAM domain